MTFDELEQIRVTLHEKHKKIDRIFFIIATLIVVTLSSFMFFNHRNVSPIVVLFPAIFFSAVFLLIIYFLVAYFYTKNEAKAYKDAYKTYFVYGSLAKIFTNIKYEPDAGLSEGFVNDFMFTYDRYFSNDLVSATYKNIKFTQADVHTEQRHESTDSKGRTTTYYVTIFKGRFLEFDFDRNFSTNIVLHTHLFPGAEHPNPNGRKFEKLKTESPDFNKHFTLYAQDGVDALYVFDPAFMEKVQNLHAACDKPLLMTFMDKKLCIALDDGKDSFEAPGYRKPLNEDVEFEKVNSDIKVITNFVDSLNLDRYFKGEKK